MDSGGLAAGPCGSRGLAPVHDTSRVFAQRGVTEISEFFTATEFDGLRRHVETKVHGKLFQSMEGDSQVEGAPAEYGDPVAEQLLSLKTSFLRDLLHLDLVPTYSYLRLYRPGDRLSAHRDRPACEITVSASLAADPAWPLGILVEGRVVDYCPAPRGAVAFRGHELLHWRGTLSGDGPVAHVLFHYVLRHGPCGSWAYDRRRTTTEAAGRIPR
jgi:alkylated DNA repair dioxygenase AlkB